MALRFENLVTARGAKSIISSDMCLVPPIDFLDSLGYSKFIFGPNFGPNWSQTAGLEGQKPANKHYKTNDFLLLFFVLNKFSGLIVKNENI